MQEAIDRLRTSLQNYYGALNEIALGLSTKVPEKPQVLAIYELCKLMNLPLVEGGLQDQPYEWLIAASVIEEIKGVFEANMKASAKSP